MNDQDIKKLLIALQLEQEKSKFLADTLSRKSMFKIAKMKCKLQYF